jgi:hypothetical protein
MELGLEILAPFSPWVWLMGDEIPEHIHSILLAGSFCWEEGLQQHTVQFFLWMGFWLSRQQFLQGVRVFRTN